MNNCRISNLSRAAKKSEKKTLYYFQSLSFPVDNLEIIEIDMVH
jgi:hypothetical protein